MRIFSKKGSAIFISYCPPTSCQASGNPWRGFREQWVTNEHLEGQGWSRVNILAKNLIPPPLFFNTRIASPIPSYFCHILHMFAYFLCPKAYSVPKFSKSLNISSPFWPENLPLWLILETDRFRWFIMVNFKNSLIWHI